MDGYQNIMTITVAAEDSIVVVTIDNHSEDSSSNPVSGQFLILVLSYLCSVEVGA